MVAIRASLHLPFDHHMFVQNLTLQVCFHLDAIYDLVALQWASHTFPSCVTGAWLQLMMCTVFENCALLSCIDVYFLISSYLELIFLASSLIAWRSGTSCVIVQFYLIHNRCSVPLNVDCKGEYKSTGWWTKSIWSLWNKLSLPLDHYMANVL